MNELLIHLGLTLLMDYGTPVNLNGCTIPRFFIECIVSLPVNFV